MGGVVNWIDARGRAVGSGTLLWPANRGDVKLRCLGFRNVGDRELKHLVVGSKRGPVTKVTFRHLGPRRRFSLRLHFGALKPGKRVLFWVREEFTGIPGPASEIKVEGWAVNDGRKK